jgi:hypothetical protein
VVRITGARSPREERRSTPALDDPCFACHRGRLVTLMRSSFSTPTPRAAQPTHGCPVVCPMVGDIEMER